MSIATELALGKPDQFIAQHGTFMVESLADSFARDSLKELGVTNDGNSTSYLGLLCLVAKLHSLSKELIGGKLLQPLLILAE
jgi:hypothetical protein